MMGIKKTSIIERERNLADIYVHTLHCSSTDETHCVLERDGEFVVVVLIFLAHICWFCCVVKCPHER